MFLKVEDFQDILIELETLVVESFMWPVGLVIDPVYLKMLSPTANFTRCKLPITGEMVPIIQGPPGSLYLKVSGLAEL